MVSDGTHDSQINTAINRGWSREDWLALDPALRRRYSEEYARDAASARNQPLPDDAAPLERWNDVTIADQRTMINERARPSLQQWLDMGPEDRMQAAREEGTRRARELQSSGGRAPRRMPQSVRDADGNWSRQTGREILEANNPEYLQRYDDLLAILNDRSKVRPSYELSRLRARVDRDGIESIQLRDLENIMEDIEIAQGRGADKYDARRERKLAAAGSGTKNNGSIDEAMAVMPASGLPGSPHVPL
jgi:hypothetical protein